MNQYQISACLCIPDCIEGSDNGVLIAKSKLTARWSLLHVTILLQQPYINVLKFNCFSPEPLEHAGYQRVSFSPERQKDKALVVGQLHPQLMEISFFDFK